MPVGRSLCRGTSSRDSERHGMYSENISDVVTFFEQKIMRSMFKYVH